MWLPHPPVPQVGNGRRILHIATRFLKGGAERNIAHAMAWERAAGFEVELAIGPDSDPSYVPDHFVLHPLLHLQRSLNPIADLRATAELRQLIRAKRYDVVHTHLSKAGIVGRLAALGAVPAVVHTVHMSSFGPAYGRTASVVYRLAERRCAAMAHLIAFVGTDLLCQYVDAGVADPSRSMVVRSPIELDPFFETRAWSDEARRDVRRVLGLDTGTPVLAAVGALERRKRYPLMLSELSPLLRSGGAQLVVAGDGYERQALLGLADRLGISSRVHLLGQVDGIPELLGAADALVHTSAAEGVPQVVIQALAAGLRVVATDVAGLREIPDAPVSIVPHGGEALGRTVEDLLAASPVSPAQTSSFVAWTCPAVDTALGGLHARLAEGAR